MVEKPKLANHKHSYAPLYLVRRPTGQGLLISVCKHAVFFFIVYLQRGQLITVIRVQNQFHDYLNLRNTDL